MKISRCVAKAVFLLTAILCGVRCLSLRNVTEKAQLEIYPQGEALIVPSAVPFDLRCYLNGADSSARMVWIDPKGEVIPEWITIPYLVKVSRSYSSLRLSFYLPQRDHSGKYTCLAEYNDTSSPDGIEKVEASVNVTVLDNPRITWFESVTVEQGSTAVLRCNARSIPSPNITIWKGEDPYFAEKDDRIQVNNLTETDTNSVTVTINKVKRCDEGPYYCIAEANGFYANWTAYIEVQFAPNLTATAPIQLLSKSGNFTNLTCIAEGNPPPVISWKFGNAEIDPENQLNVTYGRKVVSHLLVYVNKTTDVYSNVYGTYKCIATNNLGSRSVNITLQEAVVPGEITRVIFESVTPRSITFRFLGPLSDGGKPIIAYVVNYSSPEHHNSVIEWPVGSLYIVSNLRPGANYTFRVAAKNAVGIGAWKKINYLMPKEKNDTTVEPNTLITKDVNITDYPDRYEIRWKVHDDYGVLKRYFVVTYFDDGRIKVDHQNGNITFPL